MLKDKEKKERDDPYALKYIYEDMELELVASFRRNLIKHKVEEYAAGFSWEMWQLATLRNIETYRKENRAIISRYEQGVQNIIEETLQHTYTKGQKSIDDQMGQIELDEGSYSFPENGKNVGKRGKIPPQEKNFFHPNEKKLNAMIKSTKSDFEEVNHAIYRKMDDVYRQTVYKASIQLANGSISLDKAIDNAAEAFLDKGIDSIVYANGRHVNIATYAEMALRTTSHRASLLGEGSKRDEYGRHLVVVSAHANSCQLCMQWQGQVLIDDVFSHPNEEYLAKYKGKYKLLSQAIKTGLMHPNCRHTISTYFEGITRLPTITDPEKAKKNYDTEQKQRSLENRIRKAKREYAGTVDEDSKETVKKQLLTLQKQLRDYLKANPQLKRHAHREKVYGTKQSISSALKNFDDSILQDIDKDTIIEVDKALSKIYKEYPSLKGIIGKIETMNEGTASAEINIENKGISVSLGINSKLTPKNAEILTKKMYDQHKWTKKPGIEGIIRHEMGHVLNYDYYVRKNGLQYGKPYGDSRLQKLIDDLKTNEFSTLLRKETLSKLGVENSNANVEKYFSKYANKISVTKNGEFFAEAFSDYSDTEAKNIFMKLLRERMK